MKDIILVGGFHEMIELCEDAGCNIIGIIDNNLSDEYYGYPIIGKDSDAPTLFYDYQHSAVVITPDEPHLRKKLVDFYRSIGFSFLSIIHPEANVSRYANIGEGTIVQRGVNISANTTIGDFCKLNTKCNVMHDIFVADFATIAPNAVLLGYVSIGKFSYIGANSTILPRCSVGKNTIVGAGAVVTKNVQPNVVVFGVPAREK